jgi:hypothetical protein
MLFPRTYRNKIKEGRTIIYPTGATSRERAATIYPLKITFKSLNTKQKGDNRATNRGLQQNYAGRAIEMKALDLGRWLVAATAAVVHQSGLGAGLVKSDIS